MHFQGKVLIRERHEVFFAAQDYGPERDERVAEQWKVTLACSGTSLAEDIELYLDAKAAEEFLPGKEVLVTIHVQGGSSCVKHLLVHTRTLSTTRGTSQCLSCRKVYYGNPVGHASMRYWRDNPCLQ